MLKNAMFAVCGLLVAGLLAGLALAADEKEQTPAGPAAVPAIQPEVKAKADASLAKGVKFLLAAQDQDASWGGKFGPAVTAMAVKALVQAGEKPDSPAISKAIDLILSKQVKAGPGAERKPNPLAGAFSDKELANYNTAICMSTLVMLNKAEPLKGKFDQAIKDGLAYLRRDQWGEDQGLKKEDAAYGGFGYGGGKRPDLSNTNATMDSLKALQEAGYIKDDDPMFEKVKVFLTHCQNDSEGDSTKTWKATYDVGNDGGFIYTPATSPIQGGPRSNATKDSDLQPADAKSKLVSYGSMTYAGFKSYLYSGLTKADPRVTKAFQWICQNYRLDENPGVGQDGLFYYYHTLARALHANDEPKITDAAKVVHDWRAELIDKLASIQQEDGSWVNKAAKRWEEGNPVLATCFAMLAMEEAISPMAPPPAAADDTFSCVIKSAGVPVLQLTVPAGTTVKSEGETMTITSKDKIESKDNLRFNVWTIAKAKTADEAAAKLGEIIKPEFLEFKQTATKDVTVAGVPAKMFAGSGKEADDGDPGNAEVYFFVLGGHVFATCVHGEGTSANAYRPFMMSVLQTAKAP